MRSISLPITPDRYLEPYFDLTEEYYKDYFQNDVGKDPVYDLLAVANITLHMLPAVFISAYKAHKLDYAYHVARQWRQGIDWFTDSQRYQWFHKASKSKRLLGRIGSKFIPGLGFVSVAYDVYSVAKWADERWDLF